MTHDRADEEEGRSHTRRILHKACCQCDGPCCLPGSRRSRAPLRHAIVGHKPCLQWRCRLHRCHSETCSKVGPSGSDTALPITICRTLPFRFPTSERTPSGLESLPFWHLSSSCWAPRWVLHHFLLSSSSSSSCLCT